METNEEINILLWEYIDGSCSISDMQRISVLIERDPLWKEKYTELSAFHAGISNSLELEHPSMRFTQNVMDAVAAQHIAPATKQYINKGIIRSISAFFIIILTTIIGYALATSNWGTSATGALSRLNFNKINLSKLYNGNVVMMLIAVNIVIGLVLLDTMLHRKKATHLPDQ